MTPHTEAALARPIQVRFLHCQLHRGHDETGGLQGLLDSAQSKQNIAVFTSGGTITALLHLITGLPVAAAFELNWQIVNTSLSCLKFRGNSVQLASFNSHAHLQLLKAPQLITYR